MVGTWPGMDLEWGFHALQEEDLEEEPVSCTVFLHVTSMFKTFQDKTLQWIKIIKFYKYHISYTIQTSWETWGQEPFRSLNCALSLHAIFHYTSPSLGVKMLPLFFWLQRLRADDVWVLLSWNIWSTQKRFNIGKLLANHLFGDRIGNN